MRRQQGRARALVVAAIAATLTLSGCVAGSSTSSDSSSSSATSGSPAPEDSTSAAKELVIAIPAYPSSWDQDFVAFDLVALSLFKNVYPYLVDYGVTEVDGARILDTENILPTWAESFTSEDGKLWTLKLRPDATFPSGNPITAEDVKWSKDRAFAAQANVAGVYGLIGLTEPDQIKVVDDLTVTFEQAFPSALTPQIQAISLFLYDSKLLKEKATAEDPWAAEWVAQNPADGGLFKVASFTPGQEIVLEANRDYPAADGPLVDTIRLVVVPESASAALLLEQGDVDIALGLGGDQINDLKGKSGIKVLTAPSNEMISIPINVAIKPLDNVNVRQAIAHAIPYDQILQSVYGGDGRIPKSPVPIDMPGYSETGFPYAYDVEKAQQLMADSGVAPFETELAYAAESPNDERIAIIVQAALKEIGITVTPTPLDPATFGERRQAKDIPMQITAAQWWVNDVEYMLATGWTTGAFLNYASYSNPVLDKAVEEVRGVTDPAARDEIWLKVQGEFAREVPVIPLVQPNFNLAVRENVDGWVQPVDGLARLQYLTIN